MRLLLSCNGCKATSVVSCSGCPPETPGGHLGECPLRDLGAAVSCQPGSGCCAEDHSHDQAANACSGPGAAHQGGCGKDVPGCAVCRPITVTVLDIDVPAGLVAGG
jgi:hypothetical protein